MSSAPWLRLTDYASKYRVSISTLRRRIKEGRLSHRFEEGRYLVVDEAPKEPITEFAPEIATLVKDTETSTKAEPILASANRLLSELKLAYTAILHEKEEQLIELKSELSNLHTLIRVLEDDNRRLRSRLDLPQNEFSLE